MVAGLDVHTSVNEDAVVVAAVGEVDIATASLLDEALAAVLAAPAGAKLLCCDLSQVTFLDSTGLGTLARVHALADAQGFVFCLTGASARVEKVLRLTAMDGVLRSYESVEEARRLRGDDPDALPVA